MAAQPWLLLLLLLLLLPGRVQTVRAGWWMGHHCWVRPCCACPTLGLEEMPAPGGTASEILRTCYAVRCVIDPGQAGILQEVKHKLGPAACADPWPGTRISPQVQQAASSWLAQAHSRLAVVLGPHAENQHEH